MDIMQSILQTEKIKLMLGVLFTLSIIYLMEQSLTILFILLMFWFFFFRPWNKKDLVIFIIASLFFLGQNYAVLKTGGFSFKHKDILLMPYYEPFMWGFYYLIMKRFIAEPSENCRLRWKAFAGLMLTGFAFSFFAKDTDTLFISTLVTTCILLVTFHERYDIYYALCALILGFIIELFGVSTGLWAYPAPDFLGIPFWFATMWISVGILGRRLLIPLSESIAKKVSF